MSFKRHMPSINALVTFEAAMRLKSFTAAARELSVTQAAVSRQIRFLEEDFGILLFQRSHRRVQPTPAGEMLGTSMRQALEMVREAVAAVRSYHGMPTLTVGATLACSYFWLLPKLPKFREQFPDLKIRLITQDDPFDLASGELDVVLRFGIPPFTDGYSVASANERFFPVCSPAFAERFKTTLVPRDLLVLPLIGCDAPDTSWMFWPDWFERVGLGRRAPATALQFNHYTDGIAAALAGQGVALGWDMILGDLLVSGQLVCLGKKVPAKACYNAVVPSHRTPSSAAESFVQWIGRMFAETASPAAASTQSPA